MADILKLKKSTCTNCHKCIRHCPVKSIRFVGSEAHVIEDACIYCGECLAVCPKHAREVSDSVETVRALLSGRMPVIASIDPSYVAFFENVGRDGMKEALRRIGFHDVKDTARGSAFVKMEYDRILEEEKPDILITSACHSVNLLIQKYYKKALPYLAPVMSPMQAHAIYIKKKTPGAKVVYIGPCIAKKDEAARYGDVDAVLTFDELSKWLQREHIKPVKKDPSEIKESKKASLFAITGGITKVMKCVDQSYTYLTCDGVENCMETLRDIEKGKLHHCFIEMNICDGGCIGGHGVSKSPSHTHATSCVINRAGKQDSRILLPADASIVQKFKAMPVDDRMPTEEEIKKVMHEMGKDKPSDELNCGGCGYNTCREKAIAVLQGKAEISMCLPYLKEKAETFSDAIIKNTPNGIFVLNENLEIQQINHAALVMMELESDKDIIGESVSKILDQKIFTDVKRTGRGVVAMRTYLEKYNIHVEQSIIYDKTARILICVMRDITNEQTEREKKEAVNRQTVEVADKVVEKQMRIVQEIASLLGETAAETKIALTKLKESIADE